MRDEKEIREWLKMIERKSVEGEKEFPDALGVYVQGWVDALKWVLEERDKP